MHPRTPVRAPPRRGRRGPGLLGLPMLDSTPPPTPPAQRRRPTVKVMTRNLYLGADIMRPIAAIAAGPGGAPRRPARPARRVRQRQRRPPRDIVDATNFPARAELLAGEISSAKPDLVGLQEVALWRSGPMDFRAPTPLLPGANATVVDYDFLQILLDELVRGRRRVQGDQRRKRADVEGPAYEGSFGTRSSRTTDRDVRLTMRDVIMMRVGSAVKYDQGQRGQRGLRREHVFDLDGDPETDNAITFSRGYQWVDMRVGRLEVPLPQHALRGVRARTSPGPGRGAGRRSAGYKGTTIVCPATATPTRWTDHQARRDQAALGAVLPLISGRAASTTRGCSGRTRGGLDLRAQRDRRRRHRRRLRPPDRHGLRPARRTATSSRSSPARSTGDELDDRNEDGLWPSDHAGVVMKLRLRVTASTEPPIDAAPRGPAETPGPSCRSPCVGGRRRCRAP